ncbi:hypothetical protein EZS27_003608 [termite gut metagenome]|uniref:Uncharacterized protein n=1 Tax=termite gut metagenome TaxID=433724 RepID=A0A5J4SSU1_9ZZZZ
MNATQENAYKKYPTYLLFLEEQKPEQMLMNYDTIHNVEEIISKIRLSVAEMDELYRTGDFSPGADYYARWLQFFNRFANINKEMPKDVIGWAAVQLYAKYSHFYFPDLKLIFEQILEARYGKFYGSVDTVLVMSAFLQYDEDRNRLLHQEEQRRKVERDLWYAKRIVEIKDKLYTDLKEKHPDWENGEILNTINKQAEQHIQQEAKTLFR